jgi:hypothetical protein
MLALIRTQGNVSRSVMPLSVIINLNVSAVTGLPREWQDMLQASGVSRQEQEKNPEAVSGNGWSHGQHSDHQLAISSTRYVK